MARCYFKVSSKSLKTLLSIEFCVCGTFSKCVIPQVWFLFSYKLQKSLVNKTLGIYGGFSREGAFTLQDNPDRSTA